MNKVVINSDLSMPLGKKVAQASHGAMRMIIERFEEMGDKLILSNPEALEWFLEWEESGFSLQIEESSLSNKSLYGESETATLIVDRGRTVFNGVETETVMGIANRKLPTYSHTSLPDNRDDEVRQIFVINKEAIHDEIEFLSQIASLSAKNMVEWASRENGKVFFDLKKNPDLREWLFTGYAKISLEVKTYKKMENFYSKLQTSAPKDIFYSKLSKSNEENIAFCIGPHRKSLTDNITKRLRLF